MARLTAVFIIQKVLPLPGLNDVATMVLCCLSRVINSMLVRSTRNASFMMLRLPSCTTTGIFSFFLFFCTSCGISPIMGVDRPLRSLRPRTLVLAISRMATTAAGMSRPMASAIRMVRFFMGAVGVVLPVGDVMMRVLYAVKACDSWFSSRFCKRKRYSFSFTLCSRSADARYFVCSGFLDISSIVFFVSCSSAAMLVSTFLMDSFAAAIMDSRLAASCISIFFISGLFSPLFSIAALRSMTARL